MSTPSTTNQTPGFCFFKGLPIEIFYEIFSHLTVLELARIQRTCKEWHTEIQKNSKLWTRSGPFFEHFRMEELGRSFHQGFKALRKLSKNNLDEIGLYIDGDDLCRTRKLMRDIPKLNPTSLKITCWNTEGHHDQLATLLSQCHSLRKLTIDFDEKMLDEYREVDILPEKKIKLDSLSLNESVLETWQSKEASMRTFSSIKTFTLRLQPYKSNKNIYDIFDFFQHFRQSIESITILDIIRTHLKDRQTEEMLGKEIVFPNLIQADFNLSFQVLDKWDGRQLYRFNCPKIQELSFGHDFFWYLFDTTKSLKKLKLTWELNDLEKILQTFPCIETLQIRLLKEETLRSLIKQVPDQLKYLQVDVYALCKYHATSSLQKYATHHLLDLVKKNNATIQSNSIFRLLREGAAEFCKISVSGLHLNENRNWHTTKFYMCKDNFLQIFTELASKETSSVLYSNDGPNKKSR